MYNNLELRMLGNSSGDSLRVSFKNCLEVTIHYEKIRQEAINLGGTIANESLILFTSQSGLMKLISFIASL